jgi:hypothetical protein
MGDTTDDDDPRRSRHELAAAIILGVAGILTAFAAYKAALTDGDALKGYTESATTTADANGFFNEAVSTYTSDQSLFLEYQLLVEQGDTELAQIFRDRFFSAELEAGTAAWDAIPVGDPDEPPTPLDTAEYAIPEQAEAERLAVVATEKFEAAQEADDAGDKFELAAVFLSVALFLAGIGTLFQSPGIRTAVLVMSVVALVPGIYAIVQGQNALS